MKELWIKLKTLVRRRMQDSIVSKVALLLSIVVVFCTTYLLVLPAITLSTDNSPSIIQPIDDKKTELSESGSLSLDTDNFTVRADYKAGTFDVPVQLKVTSVTDPTAITRLSAIIEGGQNQFAQAHPYDISFVAESGERIEPKKEVTMSIAFKETLKATAKENVSWKWYHFVDENTD